MRKFYSLPLFIAVALPGLAAKVGPSDSLKHVSSAISLEWSSDIPFMVEKSDLSVREALAEGLRLRLRGDSPTRVLLRVVSIQGRVIQNCDGRAFQAEPGVNRVPPVPSICIPEARVDRGDQIVTGDRFLPGDEATAGAREIAESGNVFGAARVDWREQQVLYLVAVPYESRDPEQHKTRPLAYIMDAAGR